jgi:hypothetical protein
MRHTVVAVLLSAIPAPLLAQWVNYPTQGIPRSADGKPNLSAPAPRTADGKPDLSGMWEAEKRSLSDGFGGSGPRTEQFRDIGAGLAGGLPYQPWAANLAKARNAENSKDNPDPRCLPLGILQMHTHPFPRKVIQTPGLLIILHERNMEYRQIFTDGRPLPDDPQPSWNGYSSGKWEGDTLVVTTTGFRDGLWADYNGSPMTDAAKMTERFRRPNYGHLEIEVTLDDPKAYTKPWTTTLKQIIAFNTELMEYVCLENEKDVSHLVGK